MYKKHKKTFLSHDPHKKIPDPLSVTAIEKKNFQELTHVSFYGVWPRAQRIVELIRQQRLESETDGSHVNQPS